MSRLFPPRTTPAGNALPEEGNALSAADPQDLGTTAAAPLLTDERGRPLSLPRGKPITEAQLRKQYQRAPSFASRLPWVEYLP
ncbi:hypothetical protein NPJ88_021065, partial [Halomonas elongata]|uniref:hypothetical protein n=1 Tax=Halomonas elongata TaxID=2746 RepID=UPI00255AAC20